MQGTVTTEKRRPGRRSIYAAAVVDRILERLAVDESLRRICDEPGMPSVATFFRWLDEVPGLRERYIRAREAQAETMDSMILDAATSIPERVTVTTKHGSSVSSVDQGEVAHRRLLVDTLKWRAAHLRPKVYGVLRVEQEHSLGGSLEELVRAAAAIQAQPANPSLGAPTDGADHV